MEAEASFNSTGDTSPGNIAHATVVILIGILVSVCSFLTILAVHKFRSVSNPDILILALAIIDFISSFTVFPLGAFWYLRTVAYPGELCLVYGALTTTVQLASTVVVSLMTVDRFLAIRRPILYRTRLGCPQLKRLVVILVILSAVIGCLPAALSPTRWTAVTNRHGYCTFRYSSDFTFVILALSLPQIPLLLYCYYGFLVSIRKFIRRRQSGPAPSPASSSVSSSELERRHRAAKPPAPSLADRWQQALAVPCRVYCCCCCCSGSGCRVKQARPATRDEMVERSQAVMKNLNLKRCTRMSKTVALVVFIYYIPWLLTLITMTIELITRVEKYSSTLSLVAVRLMMAHSILYPLVYASLCGNYRQAYKWALSLPFHPCGLEWHERPPLGISVSEMHRISHQMALDEWESPGLNRRLYSKRPYLKRSTTDSMKDAPNAEAEPGRDNAAFERNEMTSSDQTVELDGHVTVEVVHERVPVQSPAAHPTPSVSVHPVVAADTPSLPYRSRRREDLKQASCAPRRPLENQTSDSGVDVDSIHLDSAPSGSNSPAVIRLQTVESESSTSMSEAADHLVHADESCSNETSLIQPSGSKSSVLPQRESDSGHSYTRLQTVTKDRLASNRKVQRVHSADVRTENDDGNSRETDVISQTGDAIDIDEPSAQNAAVHTKMLESLSKGYSIKETLPGRNSVLRVEPFSPAESGRDLVRIHVEVVELRPDSPPLGHDTCTLQSSTKQCRVKAANQKPTLKFSMQKNRFVPSTSSFEETESFSISIDGQAVGMSKDTVTAPRLRAPNSDNSFKDQAPPIGNSNETRAANGDLDEKQLSDEPPAKGFKSRRMRASRALRESARYDDDIVRYGEMMMRKQNAVKLAGRQDTPKTASMETLLVPDESRVIVTDHIDL